MRIGQVKDFERGRILLRKWQILRIGLWNRREVHFPFVIRIVDIIASISDNKATNLIGTQRYSLQNINNFALKVEEKLANQVEPYEMKILTPNCWLTPSQTRGL